MVIQGRAANGRRFKSQPSTKFRVGCLHEVGDMIVKAVVVINVAIAHKQDPLRTLLSLRFNAGYQLCKCNR